MLPTLQRLAVRPWCPIDAEYEHYLATRYGAQRPPGCHRANLLAAVPQLTDTDCLILLDLAMAFIGERGKALRDSPYFNGLPRDVANMGRVKRGRVKRIPLTGRTKDDTR